MGNIGSFAVLDHLLDPGGMGGVEEMKYCQVCGKEPAQRKYCLECAKKVFRQQRKKAARERNKIVFKSFRKRIRRPRVNIDASECVGNYEAGIYFC